MIGATISRPNAPSVDRDEVERADAQWQAARRRGATGFARALEALGPHLAPHEVASRLGVSRTTVNNRRAKGSLLALKRDEHQFVYPGWQFADSDAESDLGLLPHFVEVLAALGGISAWEKARFFRSPNEALRGRAPIDLLAAGSERATDDVLAAAKAHGQMGR